MIAGGVAALGALYLLTKKSTPVATQGTGVQGTANALTGFISAIGKVFKGPTSPATGGQQGASSASPPQINAPTLWPWDTPVGANGLPCTDISNDANADCGATTQLATASPDQTDQNSPLSAIPDFTPGGTSVDGSSYSDANQAPTPDTTYQDYSIPTVLA